MNCLSYLCFIQIKLCCLLFVFKSKWRLRQPHLLKWLSKYKSKLKWRLLILRQLLQLVQHLYFYSLHFEIYLLRFKLFVCLNLFKLQMRRAVCNRQSFQILFNRSQCQKQDISSKRSSIPTHSHLMKWCQSNTFHPNKSHIDQVTILLLQFLQSK